MRDREAMAISTASAIRLRRYRSRPMAREDYGGFDHDFVEDVPDDLYCGICTKVLREPSLTLCCGQHFCHSCLDHWVSKQNTCPHCRQQDFRHVMDKSVHRKVNSLQVHCLHSELGCQWTGELGNMEEHCGTGCGYVQVSCSNKCGIQTIKRKDLQFHLLQECLLRDYQCEHCGFNETYQVVTEHYDTCSEYPIQCPEGCTALVKRSKVDDHKTECPLEAIQCPYSEAGCEVSLLRKDLDEHLANGAHQHLSMIMRPFLQMKAQLEIISGSVSELCAKVVTLEVDVNQMRREKQREMNQIQREMNQIQREMYQRKQEMQEMQQKLKNSNGEVERVKTATGCMVLGLILLFGIVLAIASLCM